MRHASRRASQSLGQAADRVRRVALLLSNAEVATDRRSSTLRDKAEPIRPTAICGNLGAVMRVGLIMFHGSPRAPTSVCDHMKLQTFFDGAGFALCCGPRRVGRDMPVGLLLVMRCPSLSTWGSFSPYGPSSSSYCFPAP